MSGTRVLPVDTPDAPFPTAIKEPATIALSGDVSPRLIARRVGTDQDVYSIDKFLALDAYVQHGSPWQALYLFVVTPLPGLITALVPAFVPLRDVAAGPDDMFCCHYIIFSSIVALGIIMPAVAVTGVPTDLYSLREMMLVSMCCGLLSCALTYPVARFWRFPVPFISITLAPLWGLALLVAHVLILRCKLWRDGTLLRAMKPYVAPFMVQISQIAVYPAFSVLFDRLDNNGKVAMSVLFPLMKFGMKRVLRQFTRELQDFSGEVAVSGIEIASSLYQSMVMQTAPSGSAMAIVIGVDVLMGIASIKMLMDKRSSVPRHELLSRALQLVRLRSPTATDCQSAIAKKSETTDESRSSGGVELKAIVKVPSDPVLNATIVHQALAYASAAESILLIEYFEVVIPLINCVFLAVTTQFRSCQYNARLSGFYGRPDRVGEAVQSILLYSLLQGITCVAMHLVMTRRYGTSAIYHLAFVLERHALSIRGKMISWLPFILYFTVVHYGTDFSFKFDYTRVPSS